MDERKDNALPNHPFWQFSLDIYSQKAVETALLTLQNQYHLYVNLMLYCCWHAKMGYGHLNQRQIKDLLAVIGPWNQGVVSAIRKIREQLKAPATVNKKAADLRKIIKTLEYDCEHVEQLMLAEWLLAASDPMKTLEQQVKDAMQNLAAYFKLKRIPIDQSVQECLAALLVASFPALPHEDMSAVIGRPLDTLNITTTEEQTTLF